MRGSGNGAVHMIRTLGHRIQALHIHDNDGRYDSHQIPGSMTIDFDAILHALKAVDYKGYFTLEANRYLQIYSADKVLDGLVKLKESVSTLARRYEEIAGG